MFKNLANLWNKVTAFWGKGKGFFKNLFGLNKQVYKNADFKVVKKTFENGAKEIKTYDRVTGDLVKKVETTPTSLAVWKGNRPYYTDSQHLTKVTNYVTGEKTVILNSNLASNTNLSANRVVERVVNPGQPMHQVSSLIEVGPGYAHITTGRANNFNNFVELRPNATGKWQKTLNIPSSVNPYSFASMPRFAT